MGRTTRRALAVAGVVALAALLAPQPVQADPMERVLNGHGFMPTGHLPDPFLATYVRSSTGGAVFELPLLNIDIGGDEVDLFEGNVLYLTQGFEYQQQVMEWLAIRFGAFGLGRGGIEGSSILAQGVSWGVGGSAGASARLWRWDKAQISATADVSGGSLWTINLIDFVDDLVENGWTEDSSIADETTISYPRAGLNGAWAPKPWLGLTGYLELGWMEAWGKVSGVSNAVSGGVTAGIDFAAIGGAPVGLLFSYEVDPFLLAGDDHSLELSSVGVGVFYTGREDLGLGLEATAIHAPQGYNDEMMTIYEFSTVMHFFF
jgi:hypothetical protein